MKTRKMLLCGVATAALMIAGAVSAQANGAGPSVADTWAGFYVGGHAGYGQATYKGRDSDGATELSTKPVGFLVGLHAGYNWQRSEKVVWGVEADVSATPGWRGNQQTCTECSSGIFGELGSLASIRGRLGWTFDRSLVYATGGIAFATSTAVGASSDPDSFSRASAITAGPVAGAGIEWMHSQNLSLRVEGLYYWFSEERTNTGTSGEAGIKNAAVVRVGASWHY